MSLLSQPEEEGTQNRWRPQKVPTLFDGLPLPEAPPPTNSKPARVIRERKRNSRKPIEYSLFDTASTPAEEPTDLVTVREADNGQLVLGTRKFVQAPDTFRDAAYDYAVDGQPLTNLLRIDQFLDEQHPETHYSDNDEWKKHIINLSKAQLDAIAVFCQTDQNIAIQASTSGGKTVFALFAGARELVRVGRFTILTPTRGLVHQTDGERKKFMWIEDAHVLCVTGEMTIKQRVEAYKRLNDGSVGIFIATPHVVHNDLEAGRLSVEQLGTTFLDEAHFYKGKLPYPAIGRRLREGGNRAVVFSATLGEQRSQICKELDIDPTGYRPLRFPAQPKYFETRNVELGDTITELRELIAQDIRECAEEILQKIPNEKAKVRLFRRLFSKSGDFRLPDFKLCSLLLRYVGRVGDQYQEQGSNKQWSWRRCSSLCRELDHLRRMYDLIGEEGLLAFKRTVEGVADEKSKSGWVKRLYSPEQARGTTRTRNIRQVLEAAKSHLEENPLDDHPKTAELLRILRIDPRMAGNGKAIVRVPLFERGQFYCDAINNSSFFQRFGIKATLAAGSKHMKTEEYFKSMERFQSGEARVLVGTPVIDEGIHVPRANLMVLTKPVSRGEKRIQVPGRVGRLEMNQGKKVLLARIVELCVADTADKHRVYAGEQNVTQLIFDSETEDW